MTRKSTDLTVAKTILTQLGGTQFIIMTGSKNFVAGDDNLTFKVGKNPERITHVRITLTPLDLYTVEFLKIRNFEAASMSMYDKTTYKGIEYRAGMVCRCTNMGGYNVHTILGFENAILAMHS